VLDCGPTLSRLSHGHALFVSEPLSAASLVGRIKKQVPFGRVMERARCCRAASAPMHSRLACWFTRAGRVQLASPAAVGPIGARLHGGKTHGSLAIGRRTSWQQSTQETRSCLLTSPSEQLREGDYKMQLPAARCFLGDSESLFGARETSMNPFIPQKTTLSTLHTKRREGPRPIYTASARARTRQGLGS
jgi:hypothetical protein